MKLLFAKGNSARNDKYKVNTAIYQKENGQIFVRKYAVGVKAEPHIKQIAKASAVIEKKAADIKIPNIIQTEKTYIDFEYLPFPSLEQLIENCLLNRRFKQSKKYVLHLKDLASKINTINTNPYEKNQFVRLFDPLGKYKGSKKENCFAITIFDLNFDNILIDKSNNLYLVDLEWVFDFPIPTTYIQLRPLFYLSLKLQPLIAALASSGFPCFEILQNFLVPKIWFDSISLSQTEIKKYLYFEQNIQRHINFIINFSEKAKILPKKKLISKRTLPSLNTYVKHTNSLAEKNAGLKMEIQEVSRQLLKHQRILDNIKSAKFFRLWQRYCNIRDSLLHKKSNP